MNIDQKLDVKEIKKESTALAVKANSFTITTDDQYVEAMSFAKFIKESIKKVEKAFDPIIKQAHKTWKAAIAQKGQYIAPREAALKILDSKGRAFRIEQEKIRQEEQRKAQELANKEAERQRKLAEKAQARGDEKKAQEFTAKAEEVAAITPVIASKVSKIEGVAIRKIWKFRIVDDRLLPREWLTPDMNKIGATVRATKGTLRIPGIEIYQEDSSI